MRKIFCLLLMLLPFSLWAQNDFVRMIVTPSSEVTFWRGTEQLWVSAITSPPVYEANYYVATWGDDDSPGTFEEPWQSWQKALSTVVAGDSVYIRGGIYYVPSEVDNHGVYRENVNGTAENPITIMAYPGETPILNGSFISSTTDHRWGVYLYNCDYWIFKGLTITGVPQQDIAHTADGFLFLTCNNITLEKCTAYDNDGNGIITRYGSNFLIKNCDSYANDDPFFHNNGNGITIGYTNVASSDTIIGCRAWGNKWGEGFGTWYAEGMVVYDSCWAWNNTGISGDGSGFELGITATDGGVLKRVITNCIAANNLIGFSQSMCYEIMHLYNNIAYANNGGFSFAGGNPDIANIIRNNIAYANTVFDRDFHASNIRDHNSWQDGLVVTVDDFVSLSVSQLDDPRQADGSLPVVTYMHLVEGSDLIDAGVDVGLDYEGANPDIGYAESNY